MFNSDYLFDQDGDLNHSLAIESDFGPFECPSCPMFRTSDRPIPHNLFANTPEIWKELDKRGKNVRTSFKDWKFDATSITAGKIVTDVRLPYMVDKVTWKYDTETSQWLRFTDNVSHTDAVTGKQLSFANVVVLYAPHVYTSIQEDSNGSRSIRIELWGKGELRLYRDGHMQEGIWERVDGSKYSLQFKDANGEPLPLRPGTTWIEMVPPNFVVTNN